MITEVPEPMAVRRKVSFCEAVFDGVAEVEGVKGRLVHGPGQVAHIWERGEIPILVDPDCRACAAVGPEVLVDAILAKRNVGTTMQDAPLVIGIGPGFEAGRDCHFVVETNRGHHLGRLLLSGSAEPNTGLPGPVMGHTADRVLRAPAEGDWRSEMDIGHHVRPGDCIGTVEGVRVEAKIPGVIRGLIRHGVRVHEGMKIGDIDPRGRDEYCATISEKALAIAGGVLEGILRIHPR
jgi:xanthine dehydrogenase accessory factor